MCTDDGWMDIYIYDSSPDDQNLWLTLLETDTLSYKLRGFPPGIYCAEGLTLRFKSWLVQCLQDLLGHWSFCSEASSHSSKQSAKGLADHLRCKLHRVLFVHKGSDAMDLFLWSGRCGSSMTAEGQHVKHTLLSWGSGLSLITMAAAHWWCHSRGSRLLKEAFLSVIHVPLCECVCVVKWN